MSETATQPPTGARKAFELPKTLNLCKAAMAEAGRLGILMTMYFIHARKPG